MNLSLLIDLIPAKQRKILYALLTVGVTLYGVWQVADGDWGQFIVSAVTALVGTLATANTNVKPAPDEEQEGGRHSAPEE